jgi:hypothetical protein
MRITATKLQMPCHAKKAFKNSSMAKRFRQKDTDETVGNCLICVSPLSHKTGVGERDRSRRSQGPTGPAGLVVGSEFEFSQPAVKCCTANTQAFGR